MTYGDTVKNIKLIRNISFCIPTYSIFDNDNCHNYNGFLACILALKFVVYNNWNKLKYN